MMYILEKYEQKILDGTFFSKKGSIALPLTKVCATKNVFIELLYAAQIFYSEKEGKGKHLFIYLFIYFFFFFIIYHLLLLLLLFFYHLLFFL